MWAISKRVLGVAVLLLAVSILLFSEPAVSFPSFGWLRALVTEARAVFRDPGTQWMVFLCAGIYLGTFTLLGKSREQKAEKGFQRKRHAEHHCSMRS